MNIEDQEDLSTTPVDWTLVKTTSVDEGYELQVPDIKTGRAIAASVIQKLYPLSARFFIDKINSSEKPLEDFRFGFQSSCSERVEKVGETETHFLDLVVLNDDTEGRENLKEAFTAIIPDDYKINSD